MPRAIFSFFPAYHLKNCFNFNTYRYNVYFHQQLCFGDKNLQKNQIFCCLSIYIMDRLHRTTALQSDAWLRFWSWLKLFSSQGQNSQSWPWLHFKIQVNEWAEKPALFRPIALSPPHQQSHNGMVVRKCSEGNKLFLCKLIHNFCDQTFSRILWTVGDIIGV